MYRFLCECMFSFLLEMSESVMLNFEELPDCFPERGTQAQCLLHDFNHNSLGGKVVTVVLICVSLIADSVVSCASVQKCLFRTFLHFFLKFLMYQCIFPVNNVVLLQPQYSHQNWKLKTNIVIPLTSNTSLMFFKGLESRLELCVVFSCHVSLVSFLLELFLSPFFDDLL